MKIASINAYLTTKSCMYAVGHINSVYCYSMSSAQETYLDFIEITTPDATLESCDDCTQRIDFTEAFPFGQYYHTYAYVRLLILSEIMTVFGSVFGSVFPYRKHFVFNTFFFNSRSTAVE